MQVQPQEGPFKIIHNARSTKASRSRKSSISGQERQKNTTKQKKLRKMTMNPEMAQDSVIREIEEFNEKQAVKSQAGEMKEQAQQQSDIARFLDFGVEKIQSSKEVELENAIWHGLENQRELEQKHNCCNIEQEINWMEFE